MIVIIPIGLIAACLRSIAQDRDARRVRQVRYVRNPQQQQQHVVIINRAHHPAMLPSGSVQTQQISGHLQQQQYTHGHPRPGNGQPQGPSQAQQQASGSSRRRKPWQRRSKDGYAYTVMGPGS